MVDRWGYQLVQRRNRRGPDRAGRGQYPQRIRVGVAPRRGEQLVEQRAPVAGERAEPGYAQLRRLGERRPYRLRSHPLAGRRVPPRRAPRQHFEHLAGLGCGAGLAVSEHRQRGGAQPRRAEPLQLGCQGAERPVALVAPAHQARLARHGQPGAGERGPPGCDRPAAPRVVSGGREEGRLAAVLPVGLAEQAGGGGDLDQYPRGVLRQAQAAREPAQVAHAQPAGLQPRRRVRGQRLQQRLGVPDRLHRLPGAGRVDRVGGAHRRVRHGRRRVQRAERTHLAAQQHADLAGQLHGGLGDRHEQVGGDQPADRAVRVGGGAGRGGAHRRAGGEPVEDRARRRRRREHGAAQAGRVRAPGRRGGVQLGRGSAQPGRVRGADLVHGRYHAQLVIGPVHHEQRAQPLDRVAHRARVGCRSGGGGQCEYRVDARDPVDPGQPDRIEDLQREPVQRIKRPRHRPPRLRPGGERGQVGRYRYHQVRAQSYQRSQLLVGQRAHLVGKSGGHRQLRYLPTPPACRPR